MVDLPPSRGRRSGATDYIETHGTGTGLGDPIEAGGGGSVFFGSFCGSFVGLSILFGICCILLHCLWCVYLVFIGKRKQVCCDFLGKES